PSDLDSTRRRGGPDVLVVVEDVVGVVLGLDLGEPAVGVVAVRLADAAGVVVGVEKVHVDTGTVGLQGGEEGLGPRGLRGPDGVVLLGPPDRVDDDVVVHVPPRVGGGVAGGPAYGTPQMEHRRVRPRRDGTVGVLGDDVDH